MSERIEYHIGRSFVGTKLEDECPCPKAPCGLVLATGLGVNPDCPEHSLAAGKTIRQTHRADSCPALKESSTTTDEVREYFVFAGMRNSLEEEADLISEFDRWLEGLRETARAEGWDEAHAERCEYVVEEKCHQFHRNPYRKAEQ